MADAVLTLDKDDLELALTSCLRGRYCDHPSLTGKETEERRH